MRAPYMWTRLDWLSAFAGMAAVDVATLAVWAWFSEDSRVLAAFGVSWVGALVVGVLLLSETARAARRGVAPARVGQRPTNVGRRI